MCSGKIHLLFQGDHDMTEVTRQEPLEFEDNVRVFITLIAKLERATPRGIEAFKSCMNMPG